MEQFHRLHVEGAIGDLVVPRRDCDRLLAARGLMTLAGKFTDLFGREDLKQIRISAGSGQALVPGRRASSGDDMEARGVDAVIVSEATQKRDPVKKLVTDFTAPGAYENRSVARCNPPQLGVDRGRVLVGIGRSFFFGVSTGSAQGQVAASVSDGGVDIPLQKEKVGEPSVQLGLLRIVNDRRPQIGDLRRSLLTARSKGTFSYGMAALLLPTLRLDRMPRTCPSIGQPPRTTATRNAAGHGRQGEVATGWPPY